MKPITVSSTTMNTTSNVPRVPLKGIQIKEGEGRSSNALSKTTSIVDAKDKGKVILIEQSDEEKKKLQAGEMERQRQINNILRQGENDPPGLKKGDPNKHWCYDTI